MNTSFFKILPGSTPVLVSAPHIYAHRRPKLSTAYKIGEQFTGSIAEDLNKRSDVYAILSSEELDFDPNYHKEKRNPYKQKIRDLVKDNKIKYFIDIHGVKNDKMYDIAIFYPTKFSRSSKLAYMLKEEIDKSLLKDINIAIFRFFDNHQETLGEYSASKLRIPSVQIEVARYIREDDNLRNCLINNLCDAFPKLAI